MRHLKTALTENFRGIGTTTHCICVRQPLRKDLKIRHSAGKRLHMNEYESLVRYHMKFIPFQSFRFQLILSKTEIRNSSFFISHFVVYEALRRIQSSLPCLCLWFVFCIRSQPMRACLYDLYEQRVRVFSIRTNENIYHRRNRNSPYLL